MRLAPLLAPPTQQILVEGVFRLFLSLLHSFSFSADPPTAPRLPRAKTFRPTYLVASIVYVFQHLNLIQNGQRASSAICSIKGCPGR